MPRTILAAAALILAATVVVADGCTSLTETNAPTTGSLQITVSGLPGAAPAAITVTGPSGFDQAVTATTTLSALQPGTYTITASSVTNGSVSYAPSPASQGVSVQASLTAAKATVTYAVANADIWTVKPSMPTARAGLGVGVVNGILYAIGGRNRRPYSPALVYLGTIEAYDPSTENWTTQASMPTARALLGVGVVNGILYAVGGYDGTQYLRTVEAYDPSTYTWTTLASMPTARAGLGVGVINGILYAVGGYDGTQYVRTVEAYDPSTNGWTTLASMPTARGDLGVGVVNGILYAVGGSYLVVGRTFSSEAVNAYDPSTNAWTTQASMDTARSSLGVAVINGFLYAVGGYYSDPSTSGILSTLEAYDPSTNTWTTKASMPTSRAALGAGVVDGSLYAAGGVSLPPWPLFLNRVEAYRP